MAKVEDAPRLNDLEATIHNAYCLISRSRNGALSLADVVPYLQIFEPPFFIGDSQDDTEIFISILFDIDNQYANYTNSKS